MPKTLTADQVREVNALTHVENELIDEALGRILGAIERRGWGADTDVIMRRPTTVSCRATSVCSSRARTTSTG